VSAGAARQAIHQCANAFDAVKLVTRAAIGWRHMRLDQAAYPCFPKPMESAPLAAHYTALMREGAP